MSISRRIALTILTVAATAVLASAPAAAQDGATDPYVSRPPTGEVLGNTVERGPEPQARAVTAERPGAGRGAAALALTGEDAAQLALIGAAALGVGVLVTMARRRASRSSAG